MANPSPNYHALHKVSLDEWKVRREAAIKRIGELLAERPMLVTDVAHQLGMVRDTVSHYMTSMEELGLAHRTGKRVRTGMLWAAGEKPAAVERQAAVEEDEERAVKTVPAVQEGRKRHWMDVALFGPARAA